jgi:hypothetical protein
VLARLKNPKIWVAVFTLICVIYFLFALDRARLLIQEGNLVLTLFAVAIVIIPGLGLYLIAREIRFGFTMQEMGRELARTGQLPADDLPKEDSGRSVLAAADARFEAIAQSHDPDDWVMCYLLALAYDESRDRKAARASMREAARLFRSTPSA